MDQFAVLIILGGVLFFGGSHAGHTSNTVVVITIAEQVVTWAIFVNALFVSHAFNNGDQRLGRTGVPGNARILRKKVALRSNDRWSRSVFLWRYKVEVIRPGKHAYRTQMVSKAELDEGSTVAIRARRYDRKRVAYDPDAAVSTGSSIAEPIDISGGETVHMLPNGGKVTFRVNPSSSARSFVASVNAETEGQAGSGAGGAVDMAEELKKLSDLHTQGVLSDAEFTRAKDKLLSQ